MNIFRSVPFRAMALSLALPLIALLAACSVDSTTAVPSDNEGTIYNFSGLYTRTDSNGVQQVLVFPTNKQSGVDLTWMRLIQYGNVLEAYDNAGLNWSGNISGLQGGTASFNLQGQTTAGQAVEITGTMDYEAQRSFMNAAWIEPSFAGSILAQATVSPATTNSPSGNLELTSQYSSLSIGNSTKLTASGCSSTYTWECAETYGTLSEGSSTATYTRTAGTSSQSETVYVTCGGETTSVTIGFN